MWADRNGTHMTPTDKSAIDAVCIYCPETDDCYYVKPAEHGASVTLRITPSRNGQQLGVLDAAAFRELRTRFPADSAKPIRQRLREFGARIVRTPLHRSH